MHVKITESQFADNVALLPLYGGTRSAFEAVGISFVEVTSQWGLIVSLAKTKGLEVGAETEEDGTVSVGVQGGVINMVEVSIYLVMVKFQLRCTIGLLRLCRPLGI